MKIIYSIVAPAHNEAPNFPVLIASMDRVMASFQSPYEIIIVNDNSRDSSKDVLENLKKEFPSLAPIHRNSNPGVGNAIRAGLAQAQGEIIITLDSDLSHDPNEIPRLLEGLKTHDMVCGSRYMQGGKADMDLSRIVISGMFNLVFRGLLGLPVRDFTSGFRVYKRSIIETIQLKGEQFGIYIEIPIKANFAGFRITERAITYNKRAHGKTKLSYFKQGPEYLKVAIEALTIKFSNKSLPNALSRQS